ncbi:MAG TPA: prolyl oligopeptidase family serine peptidase [Candidatus Eisenbacteria bacterium]|nr:prolyl oligopeptidase family serine peptidase [Candidatus Eisenbacteria bacterium]
MRGMRIALAALLFWPSLGGAQPVDPDQVLQALDREGQVMLPKAQVIVRKYDYVVGKDTVEAIAFRPAAEGRYPGLVLIPGYSRTARDYLPAGIRFAREGFAAVAITQRGFGRSEGKPDYVGPKTMAGIEAGFRRFRRENYVDSTRMGVFGYSRGAMAASLLAVRVAPAELRAAVFGAGIYDFKKAHDDVGILGIRKNMEKEAGLSEKAVRERSSVFRMEQLACPVLILHGEKDENVPVSQAYLLRDRLTELQKTFEIRTFPEAGHDMQGANVNDVALAFFRRELASGTNGAKTP